MKMYRAFVEGENIQVVDKDGVWTWHPWAYISQSRSSLTASAVVVDALAYMASEFQPSQSAMADALAGIVETARTMTPELIRAADLLTRVRPGVDGGLAVRQRRVLRLFGIGHADAVLLERWNPLVEQAAAFVLVATRPGALPLPGERPDCIDGFAMHYEDAAPATVR